VTHEEVREHLRNRYQGRLCWQYNLGDHEDEYTPKNVLSCWVVAGAAPVQDQRVTGIVFLFEMADIHGKEQGFEILADIDQSNEIEKTWEALNRIVGQEVEGE